MKNLKLRTTRLPLSLRLVSVLKQTLGLEDSLIQHEQYLQCVALLPTDWLQTKKADAGCVRRCDCTNTYTMGNYAWR